MQDEKKCPEYPAPGAGDDVACRKSGDRPGQPPVPAGTASAVPGSPGPENLPDAAQQGDWKRNWNELNLLTKGSIVVLALLVLLGNPLIGIFYVPIFFFWFAPWTANYAKEHNRSTDWGYLFGFLGLVFIIIYWVYVSVTTDPGSSPVIASHEPIAPGTASVILVSLVYTALSLAYAQADRGIGFTVVYLLAGFMMWAIFLYIVHWLISRLHPGSSGWGIVLWAVVLLAASLVIMVILGVCIEVFGGGTG